MNVSTRPGARRALVTGASGAIGTAIARRLALRGHAVLLHAHRHLAAAESIAATLNTDAAVLAAGGRAAAVAFDLTDAAATAAACDAILADGPIQILVNNAGLHDDAVFPGMRAEQWSRVVDVNLNGFFHVTQPLSLPMIRTRWGRIISLSSVAAQMGNRGQVNYAAAKSALHGATRSLARELASRSITVNCVAPGLIATPMSDGSQAATDIASLVPMKRAGTADEVAALVDFLASDDAGYITGQVIGINGGMA